MRRLLLVLALVLALPVAGCVQITNPQFDARYRYHAEPLAPTTYAVFALRSGDFGKGPALVRLLVVDVAKHSVVASIPIGDIRVLSDVGSGASGGEASVLAATDSGFEEIDVARGRIRPVTTSIATSGSLPAGIAYEGGVRLLWSQRVGVAADFVRRPSNEQTATLDLRRLGGTGGQPAEVGELWYAGATSTNDAYFVGRSRLGSSNGTDATAWRADFLTHEVSLSATPAPWPASLESTPEMHVERPIRRWGVPTAAPFGVVVFRSPVDLSQRAVLPPVATLPGSPVPPRVIFEPGGDRYFTVEPGAALRGVNGDHSTRITERSLTQPAYSRRMPVPASYVYPAIGLTPLGVIGDTYAFERVVPLHGAGSRRQGYELVLRDLRMGGETALFGTASPVAVDYLGSYTR